MYPGQALTQCEADFRSGEIPDELAGYFLEKKIPPGIDAKQNLRMGRHAVVARPKVGGKKR